jgi:polyhydroxyalkanoate synthesis regulator phasin
MLLSIQNLEAGLNQLRGVAGRLDREIQQRVRLSKDMQERAETGIREARARADAFRNRVVSQMESTLEESRVAERLAQWRKAASDGLERALATLPVASRRDVEEMKRKLNRLQRQLRNLEKAHSA